MIEQKICQVCSFLVSIEWHYQISPLGKMSNVEKDKKGKNEVFEIQTISICMKKWTL
jgi:hypothetical protein